MGGAGAGRLRGWQEAAGARDLGGHGGSADSAPGVLPLPPGENKRLLVPAPRASCLWYPPKTGRTALAAQCLKELASRPAGQDAIGNETERRAQPRRRRQSSSSTRSRRPHAPLCFRPGGRTWQEPVVRCSTHPGQVACCGRDTWVCWRCWEGPIGDSVPCPCQIGARGSWLARAAGAAARGGGGGGGRGG